MFYFCSASPKRMVVSAAKADFPPCGFMKGEDGQLITKHNKEMAERRNMDKVLEVCFGSYLIVTGETKN